MTNEVDERLARLETRLAYQEDLLASLNQNIVELRAILDLQQGQLRLLWQQLQETRVDSTSLNLQDEIPPHY
ncbi:MAG: SlyX family protein [Cardiobacteriaceae bacterium]|nr:SlyX family protein [Cardiobacteriaceae bacterium]